MLFEDIECIESFLAEDGEQTFLKNNLEIF